VRPSLKQLPTALSSAIYGHMETPPSPCPLVTASGATKIPLSQFLGGNPLQQPTPGLLVDSVALLQIFQDAFEIGVTMQPVPCRVF
jgi:hypothetical protein